jgi:hypothetical protein
MLLKGDEWQVFKSVDSDARLRPTAGTNKRSTCDVFHTSDQYEYQFLSEALRAARR